MIILCENFWTLYASSIATLISVLISGVFAVFLFNRGIKKERSLNDAKRSEDKADILAIEQQQMKDYKDYFLVLLESALNHIELQNKFYKEISQKIKLEPRKLHLPKILQHENLFLLTKFDNKKIYKIFNSCNMKNEDFIRFNSNQVFLEKAITKTNEACISITGKQIIDISNKATSLKSEMLNNANDFVMTCNNKVLEYPYNTIHECLGKILMDYHQNFDGKPNLDWDYEKLVVPIREQLIIDDIHQTEIVNKLIFMNKQLGDTIFTVKFVNEEHAKELDYIVIEIDKAHKILTEILNKFND